MSLRLQAAFGLRREASIKIVPAWADRGDTLVLKASWNKGGREIRIPIRTPEQRQLLDEAKALAKGKSLVAPGYATYRDYLQHFRYECGRVGIHAFHGHRHLYAQTRYQELTGWQCPARGGPTSRQLTPEAEGPRSRGAGDHQPRDGPRPRADHRGVPGSIALAAMTRYIRIPKFEELTGYTVKAIARKIETGAWREGREYRRAPDGHILVDLQGYERWVENQPPAV